MIKKIFIERINTSLGRQLYQQIRNDHIDINSYHLIYGTVMTNNEADNKMYYHFQSNQNLALKIALECDIIILDIVNPSIFTQILLKYLKNIQHQRSIKVIGISSFTTWTNTKKDLIFSTEDPLEKLKQETKFKPFKQDQYLERTPDHSSVYSYELQNLLLSLNQVKLLKSIVVCRGLLYGKDFFELQNICSSLIQDKSSISYYGQGDNYVPLVHIDDFVKMISLLCERETKKEYVIAVDNSSVTQLQLLNCLCSELGLFKSNRLVQIPQSQDDRTVLNKDIAHSNLRFDRSQVFDQVILVYKDGILASSEKIFEEFFNLIQCERYKFVIVGNSQGLRSACESNLKQQYGDKLLINNQTLQSYIKDIEQKRIINQEFSAFINENLDPKRQVGTESISVYSPQILQKGIQLMIQKQERIGYIINVSDINITNVINTSSQSTFIRCDQKQVLNPSDSKSMQQLQRTKTNPEVNIYQGYNVLNYLSPQYQLLFKNYKYQAKQNSKISDELKQNQDQVDDFQTQSQYSLQEQHQSEKSKMKTQKSLSSEANKNNIHMSKSARMKEKIAIMASSPLLSIQMKQYLIDTLMPTLIDSITMIQNQKPDDIVAYFLTLLRNEAQKQSTFQKITFKPKSQKLISLENVGNAQNNKTIHTEQENNNDV